MKNTAPLKKRGPKPVEIEVDKVRALASIQCTYDEIAAVMGIKKRAFIDRINADPALREAIDEGWANGRSSIRRAQVKMLEAGNATMGIWLGKQYLGQRDQVQIQQDVKVTNADPYEAFERDIARVAERIGAAEGNPVIPTRAN